MFPTRRVHPSHSSSNLSTQAQSPTGTKPSPSLPSITRSGSPSGITGFFTKPTKWFTRSTSGPRQPTPEPRASTSSAGSNRRPTISVPTDPRPIPLGSRSAEPEPPVPEIVNQHGSRSVLDLSLARASSDFQTITAPDEGLGDLRSISRKAWSKSADNLTSVPSPKPSRLETSFFHEQKTKIEQYRTGGSPVTPTFQSPRPLPFPTVSNTSDGTPPDRPSPLSHVHSRSISHTPHIAPNNRLAPPSPRHLHHSAARKRSADLKEKPGGANRGGGFPFPFGTGAAAKQPATQPTIPIVVEPEGAVGESKRASQIILRSGFVNRLLDFSVSSPHLSSSKSWKPFKLVLKGSKLYFYKPPSDRSAAIKELFPSGLVAVVEEAFEQEEEDHSDSGAKKNAGDSKKKRAFWGRRTHPDLVVTNGKVEKGSFEALIHEAVFATTFVPPEQTLADFDPLTSAPWKLYSSSVLLCTPQLVDRARFETELVRCATFLVNSGDDSQKAINRSRASWLATEYLRWYGAPVETPTWETFKTDVLSSPNGDAGPSEPNSGEEIEEASPNVDTFPPRPLEMDKLPTFASAFQVPTSPSHAFPSPVRSNTAGARARLWTMLQQEGFTREVFLRLDVDVVVRSLLRHHRVMFEAAPSSCSPSVLLGDLTEHGCTAFFGCDEAPHWLTRIIITQILGPGPPGGSKDDFGPIDERSSRSSPTHTRSEVISKWAKIGELCRLAGDECSWRAILSALCSRPVARLEKAWKRVDTPSANVVRSWVYRSLDGEKMGVKEPRTTPWGGDGRQRASSLLSKMTDEKSLDLNYPPMEDAKKIYEVTLPGFLTCVPKINLLETVDEEDIDRLVRFWDESAQVQSVKSAHIDHNMALSFAAEPRKKGRFMPYYWSRPAGFQGIHTLTPLAFPEVLPTITLIDRSQLSRAKKVSLETTTPDIQMIRSMELNLTPDAKLTLYPNAPSTDAFSSGGLELGGMVLPVFDGELLLLVQPGQEESTPRPVSSVGNSDYPVNRTPSIRTKSAAASLERKSSRARRSSLPALSQKTAMVTAEPSSDPPLRVVIQAGTLDALVHVLIYGLNGVTVSVADDNGEMSLRDGNTRSVKVDRAEFESIWWNVFRSFVSPLVLFELLRKQYISKSTTRASITVTSLLQVLKSRVEVVETLNQWIQKGGGAQDSLDDLDLHSAFSSFLRAVSTEPLPNLEDEMDELKRAREALETSIVTLEESFTAQTMRPQIRLLPIRGTAAGATNQNFGTNPPSLDDIGPEDLVQNLDAMAGAAFRNVVQEDLFVAADILEVQSADRTGWFPTREANAGSDEVDIQTMYSHLMEIEPTSLIGDLTSDSIYRLLPPGIRSLIRAYNILRKWLIFKLIAPSAGIRKRQARMELLLQSIEVARLRSSEGQAPNGRHIEQPCVRSFVEAVICSAILSPESRLFHRAWQGVATARGTTYDSVATLLSRQVVQMIDAHDRLTVDPAWLLERMLEIISLPDIRESTSQTPVSLVNFDKRRHLSKLITNASSLTAPRGSLQRRETDRCDFERLNNIEHEVSALHFDLRVIREDSQREAVAVGHIATPSSKRALRPFNRIVIAQQDKLKRDKYLRERLSKEKRLEQQKHDKREDDINRAMDGRKTTIPASKQHRSKRSMSAFFRVMRPISTALADHVALPAHKRNPADLDFMPTQKPALSLSLVDAHIAQFINNERSYTFQLDTEDGGHYLLQATSKADMNKWVSVIHNTVRSYAQRRLTYLGDSPKPQLSDHLHSRPKTGSRDPVAVFGVDLEFLVRREYGDADIPFGVVPRVFDVLLQEVERRGLEEVGIYRVAGAMTEVSALREEFNKGHLNIDPSADIHAVCDCVKYWLRTLPEPVFPESYYHRVIDAANVTDLEERLSKVKTIVQSLPRAHYNVLKRLMEHLDRVADFEDKHHMTPHNLALVFSPNLLRAPQNNFGVIMRNMGTTTVLTKALITHLHFIFNESEGDVDNDEEEEEDTEGVADIAEEPDSADAEEVLTSEPDLYSGDEQTLGAERVSLSDA